MMGACFASVVVHPLLRAYVVGSMVIVPAQLQIQANYFVKILVTMSI